MNSVKYYKYHINTKDNQMNFWKFIKKIVVELTWGGMMRNILDLAEYKTKKGYCELLSAVTLEIRPADSFVTLILVT